MDIIIKSIITINTKIKCSWSLFKYSYINLHIIDIHSQSSQKLELQSQQSQIFTLPKINKDKVSYYTMTLNPLNNNILAVGCRIPYISTHSILWCIKM